MATQTDDWLDTRPRTETSERDVLYIDVDGYEGPLDLLLDLARRQKVDLAAISVLALAEQYLAFIEKIRRKRIDVAADYLVMAAWLAYLKSRLMVPQTATGDEPTGEMMAAMLQFRLRRLEAMRAAGAKLMARQLLGRDVFARGAPEPVVVNRQSEWEAALFDVLSAYAGITERRVPLDYTPTKRRVWSLNEAREVIVRLVGEAREWQPLDAFLADYLAEPGERATVLASSFSASLELVRQGRIELRQSLAFGPLMMRGRTGDKTGNQ